MKKQTNKKPISYIISVSLGKGCYRHIRVSGKETLHDFAGDILNAFNFDFDHLYSFFMDNEWWSNKKEYFSPYSQDSPSADCVKLSKLRLERGKQFKFLFDYGDEWRFQCKVLQVLEEDTPEPNIVRSKGESPEQYPCYDDEDDYDDEIELNKHSNIYMSNCNYDHFYTEPEFEMDIPQIPDELMAAAFQFRSDKIWKKLYDSELFAVKLSNGETGYCCIMGYLGECIALSLHIGEEGLRSYEIIKNSVDSECDYFSIFLEQNNLQMGLDNKYDLIDDCILPVKKYASEHGINLRGKKSYPNFIKYQSYCIPRIISEENDFIYLTEALNAAHAVAEELKNSNKKKLGLDDSIDTIPLLTPDENGYKWTHIELPEIKSATFPKPVFDNDVLLGQIKKLKKHGTFECRHYITSDTDFDEENKVFVFSSLILCADLDKKQDFKIESNGYYPGLAESLVEEFAEKLIEYGMCPETIITNGERSVALFSDFCNKCGIKIVETEKFEMLDDICQKVMSAKNAFSRNQEIVNMFESFNENGLCKLPDEIDEFIDMLGSMIGEQFLPDSLKNKSKK